MKKNTYAIVVDDNDEDRDLVKSAFPTKYLEKIEEYENSKDFKNKFLKKVSDKTNIPGIIFLDLRMEQLTSGLEVLEEIRNSEFLKLIPVIIISGSDEDEDILASYKTGANFYICKAEDPEAFLKSIKEIVDTIDRSGLVPSDLK